VGKELPKGSPTPPFKYPVVTRPDNPAKSDPDYPAPSDIPPRGADILAWKARNRSTQNFQKQKLFLMKNELMCID
jgi:hypothetical protein